MLSPNLSSLGDFPYTAEEQRLEAVARADKMSIQGVQPKLSAKLRVRQGLFEIVDRGGRYILKPQNSLFGEIPQNEDLTMRLAKLVGIEVPLHGMIYSKDRSLTYFINKSFRAAPNCPACMRYKYTPLATRAPASSATEVEKRSNSTASPRSSSIS